MRARLRDLRLALAHGELGAHLDFVVVAREAIGERLVFFLQRRFVRQCFELDRGVTFVGSLLAADPGRRGTGVRPARRAHQDGVDPREEVTGRLGPPVAGVGHEDDPAQIEPETGRGHHAGIGQAHGGTPAPRGRRRAQEGERQGRRAMARLPRDDGRGAAAQAFALL